MLRVVTEYCGWLDIDSGRLSLMAGGQEVDVPSVNRKVIQFLYVQLTPSLGASCHGPSGCSSLVGDSQRGIQV